MEEYFKNKKSKKDNNSRNFLRPWKNVFQSHVNINSASFSDNEHLSILARKVLQVTTNTNMLSAWDRVM